VINNAHGLSEMFVLAFLTSKFWLAFLYNCELQNLGENVKAV
jgi:hypothetical protein